MSAERTALPLSASRAGVVARLGRTIAESWRVWNGRRAMRRLNELSDWELMDIGLTRDDLRRAYHLPIFDDPTQHLQRVIQEHAREQNAMRKRF